MSDNTEKPVAEVGNNFQRAMAHLLEKDVTLAATVHANAEFAEVLQVMANRADLFASSLHFYLNDIAGAEAGVKQGTDTARALKFYLTMLDVLLLQAAKTPLSAQDVAYFRVAASMFRDSIGRNDILKWCDMAPGVN